MLIIFVIFLKFLLNFLLNFPTIQYHITHPTPLMSIWQKSHHSLVCWIIYQHFIHFLSNKCEQLTREREEKLIRRAAVDVWRRLRWKRDVNNPLLMFPKATFTKGGWKKSYTRAMSQGTFLLAKKYVLKEWRWKRKIPLECTKWWQFTTFNVFRCYLNFIDEVIIEHFYVGEFTNGLVGD